jgi:hypothetical protein
MFLKILIRDMKEMISADIEVKTARLYWSRRQRNSFPDVERIQPDLFVSYKLFLTVTNPRIT